MSEEEKSHIHDHVDALPSRDKKLPHVVIIVGMAGSGKTTLMQRINAHVHERKIPSYVINLDPAVHDTPYDSNIDIRDTVNYKEVMSQYKLGPNGGILTSLNLFATRFDQVLGFLDKRADSLDYVFIDTPGQIEIFTWSASGSIISDSLAAGYPTSLVYVIDTPRCVRPATFMSNMIYACSIMYKMKLPFLVAFNKTDVVKHEFAVEWMHDFDVFTAALREDASYMSSLNRSMSLVLDEFYATLNNVGVSAATGEGMDDFFASLEKTKEEYFEEYLPYLRSRIERQGENEKKRQEENLERFRKDHYGGDQASIPEEDDESEYNDFLSQMKAKAEAKLNE